MGGGGWGKEDMGQLTAIRKPDFLWSVQISCGLLHKCLSVRPSMVHFTVVCLVAKPLHSRSTHNFAITISASTALCINYNDFVRNKTCQF